MSFVPADKIYTYFSNNFVLGKTTNGWSIFKCPFCGDLEGKKKAAVNCEYRWVKCWVCGYSDNVVRFVEENEGIPYAAARALLWSLEDSPLSARFIEEHSANSREQSAIDFPDGYSSFIADTGAMAKRAVSYLKGRGFDPAELDRLGVGYCGLVGGKLTEFFGYLIIPFFENGRLVYYIGRDYTNNFLRYKNPKKADVGLGKGDVLFNGDCLNIYGEVFVTEGWADAWTLGRNGCSTQGWSISRRQRDKIITSGCDRLVFVPDLGADNTGVSFYDKAVEAALSFIDTKEVIVVDLSPLARMGKDVNEIGKEAVMALKNKTELLTTERAMEILTT